MTLTNEQFEYLAQFEAHFAAAIDSRYYKALGIEAARQINAIHKELFGRTKDVTCGACRLEMLQAVGKVWRIDRTEREALAAREAEEEAARKAAAKKPAKKARK